MMKNIMLYDRPSAYWEESSLPIGNGRIGATIPGECIKEILSLNEDTLWSGYPLNYNDEKVYPYLEKVRTAVFEKRFEDAEKIISRDMVGAWNESYLPMADLHLEILEENAEISRYERSLDLARGLCTTSFQINGNTCRRTIFCSYPDQVLVIHFHAERRLNIRVGLSSKLKGWNETDKDTLYYHGWCPEVVEPSYYECKDPVRYKSWEESQSIRFKVGVRPLTYDGEMKIHEKQLSFSKCQDYVLLVSSANSFVRYDQPTIGKYEQKLEKYLGCASKKTYQELMNRHISDHANLFNRVELELGHTDREYLPMETRLRLFKKLEDDPELIATAFQFGRYLTIAGSRAGSQPSNLQGIWNEKLRAPWSSNYTVNINTEMNYWPVEKCNLVPCAEPLLTFVKECSEAGSKTAQTNYHCRGWCVHHNVDLWRKTTPVGPRTKELNVLPWSFWLAGGGWLCRHLWEHYLYTQDKDFLRKDVFPISMECAAFYLDFLIEKDGVYVTCPSTSPENCYVENGVVTGVSYATAMDIQVIEELFLHCLTMSKILEISPETDPRLTRIDHVLSKLPRQQIGKYGQLQEWIEDYEENDVEHRHLSPLYGLYPSELFTDIYREDTALMQACRITLKRRGEGIVPWSHSWRINLWARLQDGEEAGQSIIHYLQLAEPEDHPREISFLKGGLFSNLFAARPLQIDGCFGFTAGIAEMLVQDEAGDLKILPAIPKAWKEGYVKGLRLRNGKTIDIEWNEAGYKKRIYTE